MSDSITLDWAALVAVTLALVHLAAPYTREVLAEHAASLGVFGSGMAVGYVFIHLFNEIDAGHDLIGNRIHLVMLVGFLVYFWVERRAPEKSREEQEAPRSRLDLRLAFGWLYGWLLLYALPDAVKQNGFLVVAPLMGVCLHLLYEDFHEAHGNARRFDAFDRFVLASGPIAGWLTDLFFFEDDAVVSDILTAFLAGSVLYKVFSREMPRGRDFNLAWFAGGVVLFAVLDGLGRG